MILWYLRNLLFSLKYKLGLLKTGVDFTDSSACFCEDLSDCPEDCGVCPFYHPDDV